MLYKIWTVGEEEYKLRLAARNAVELENKLGKHPLEVLLELQESSLPKVKDTCLILHAALQKFNHGMTLDKVYDLYDEYIEAGNSIQEVLELIMDIFRTAGFIPEEGEEKNE